MMRKSGDFSVGAADRSGRGAEHVGSGAASTGLPPGLSRTGWLAVGGLLAWAVMSLLFLQPVLDDPGSARRGDDYFAFSEWFADPSGPWPHTYFGPFYPLVIHGLRGLGASVVGVIVVQKLLLVVTAALIYRLAQRCELGRFPAAACGVAFMVHPLTQVQSNLLFSETLYLALLLAGVDLLLGALRHGRAARFMPLVAGFLALGLAALTRGNGLVLFAGLGLFALLRGPWRQVLVAGAIGALPVLTWCALNYHWYGYFKPTSSGDANIASAIVGPVMAELENKLPRRSGPEVWIEGNWYDTYDNQFTFALDMRDRALAWAVEHPLPVITGNVYGWFRTLLGPGHGDFVDAFDQPAATGWTLVSLGIRAVLLAGLFGYVLMGAWRRQPAFTIVLAAVMVAHVLTAGAGGFARFGYPVDAFTLVALALALRQRQLAMTGGGGVAASRAGPSVGRLPGRTRIALVSPFLGGGGAERTSAQLAASWAEAGADVTFVTLDATRPSDYALPPAVRRVALGLAGHATTRLAGITANLQRLRALRRFFREQQPDIVIGVMSECSILSIIAARGLPIEVVACEHIYPPSLRLASHWHWLRVRTYPRAARVVMLTNDSLQWLQRTIPTARGEVMPNPVIFPLPAQGQPLAPASVIADGQPLILGVGRLTHQKQFDLAIDAFAKVAADRPDARLVILGEGPDRPQLEEQVRRLGLEGRVLLPGWAGNLADWYRRARLLVMSSRVEGFPNVLLEALSHGCPAVSVDCLTGPRDIITDGRDGLLVPPADGADGLAAAMRRLLDDDAAQASMAAAALDVRERFALSTIRQRWQRLFADL